VKTILSIAGIAAVVFSTAVFGDPTNVPMDNAIETIAKNNAKNPGNQGLINAGDHLIDNQARQSTRGRNHAPGQQRIEGAERVERIERVERPQRPERIERVEIPTRAEIARAQRPERPERGLAKGHK
jgi:hypothetical protein